MTCVFGTSETGESFERRGLTFEDLNNAHTHDLWWWETAISTSGLCELRVVRSVAPLWLVLLQETGRLMNDGKDSVQAKIIQFPFEWWTLLRSGKKYQRSERPASFRNRKNFYLYEIDGSSVWKCTLIEVKEFTEASLKKKKKNHSTAGKDGQSKTFKWGKWCENYNKLQSIKIKSSAVFMDHLSCVGWQQNYRSRKGFFFFLNYYLELNTTQVQVHFVN